MLDPHLLRNNLNWVAHKLMRRNFVLDIKKVQEQENLRKIFQNQIEKLYSERRIKSKIIGMAKARGADINSLDYKSDNLLHSKLIAVKLKYQTLQKDIFRYALSLPNIPDDQVPDGFNDRRNVEVMRWGEPVQYHFPLHDHVELGKLINEGLNISNAVKLTGSRFVVMQGNIAHLHRALSQFMIDLHTKYHGYEEYYVPYLVNQESLYGSGQLPKFYEDLFHIQSTSANEHVYTLIPTAEVPLINIMRNTIIKEDKLPIKMVAHTPCFRLEAGTYGHRTRGLIRNHQFDKVEIVQIVHPDESMERLEEITHHAEKVLQLLKLPYRKVLLCAGNIGFAASKTYDLEVWLPACNMYCEISSCSNIKDFQARRIQARYRDKNSKKLKLLHTLNASGVAVGRALAAVLENYQLEDGRVKIPSILHPYMGGITHIG